MELWIVWALSRLAQHNGWTTMIILRLILVDDVASVYVKIDNLNNPLRVLLYKKYRFDNFLIYFLWFLGLGICVCFIVLKTSIRVLWWFLKIVSIACLMNCKLFNGHVKVEVYFSWFVHCVLTYFCLRWFYCSLFASVLAIASIPCNIL
jgi:hypothetical protein